MIECVLHQLLGLDIALHSIGTLTLGMQWSRVHVCVCVWGGGGGGGICLLIEIMLSVNCENPKYKKDTESAS